MLPSLISLLLKVIALTYDIHRDAFAMVVCDRAASVTMTSASRCNLLLW